MTRGCDSFFRLSFARLRCMTICDTVAGMARAISIRLNEEAQRALARLEASGLTRSEAVRRALVESARRVERRKALATEVAALESDEDDRQEMLEVAALMESLRVAR